MMIECYSCKKLFDWKSDKIVLRSRDGIDFICVDCIQKEKKERDYYHKKAKDIIEKERN